MIKFSAATLAFVASFFSQKGVRTKTWTKTGGHAHGITSKSDKSSKIVFRKGI